MPSKPIFRTAVGVPKSLPWSPTFREGETEIWRGGSTFFHSCPKYFQRAFTSRRLLKGPSIWASDELGSARSGSIGGKLRSPGTKGLFLRDRPEVRSAISSWEYMGGREDSLLGMIGGGSGTFGSDSKGYRNVIRRSRAMQTDTRTHHLHQFPPQPTYSSVGKVQDTIKGLVVAIICSTELLYGLTRNKMKIGTRRK